MCRSAARNTFYLKKVGVTHVLNTAEGQTSGTVDTSQVGVRFIERLIYNYSIEILQTFQYQVQRPEVTGCLTGQYINTLQ